MTINVSVKNGNRYGSLGVNGVTHSFPTQSITSTNLNHREHFDNPDLDFRTKICEILEFFPERLIQDSRYRNDRFKKISHIIDGNPGYLFLFAPTTLKSSANKKNSLEFTREANKFLINFQKECGFPFIKVFFKSKDSINDSNYYRSFVAKNMFVACIDENMFSPNFSTLYQESLDEGDQIVSFFGRLPSKRNLHNLDNFSFLSGRPEDKILRLASCIDKSRDNKVLSFLYHVFGIDACSFSTRRGSSAYIKSNELRVVDRFSYRPLTRDTKLICPITGDNLFESCENFTGKNKRHLPVATYNIITLNEQFKRYPHLYNKIYIQNMFSNVI